ncbi:MarR family winged helix-turn-helix transcriptional regulator [Ornithinimicrobium sediminis]|uniref:MarR family winged helix-turn-helix transcriptional regulator n=1 Tax=Ornithinimicrobium sediminis TaxID=2904603 RepID=UPI001E2B0CA5|nr:MarR family winged helix-turn-helix transcriptional regulator [Ornithinimicrobium sediminis]MCE0487226.1 MarR family winged helix-turn-helix transcriptional regulator [Ornithinimicrobium sediminis]
MPDAERDLAAIDAALLGLRRLWAQDRVVEDPDLGRVDLSTVWVVDAVARHGQDGLAVTDVAHVLDVAHSTASRFVSRAARAGAVRRDRSPEDARQVHVCLTDAGASLAQRAMHVRLGVLRHATAGWPQADRSAFARLLTDFAESVPHVMTGAQP